MPSIKVRFPAETYALAGHTAQLECFAYGKYVSHSDIIWLMVSASYLGLKTCALFSFNPQRSVIKSCAVSRQHKNRSMKNFAKEAASKLQPADQMKLETWWIYFENSVHTCGKYARWRSIKNIAVETFLIIENTLFFMSLLCIWVQNDNTDHGNFFFLF